jgi:hypothetical protein
MQPWFLLGAEPPVTDDEREQLTKLFYQRECALCHTRAASPVTDT